MIGPRRTAAFCAAALLFVACGNGKGATSTSTVPSTTVVADSTTTSNVPTTTVAEATTSTTEAIPVPQPAPAPHAYEPRVVLGSIEIPKLGVKKDLLEGVSLTVLDQGPGHWPGTAMPGHVGNVVVAGHRTSHDRPFRHIDELVVGDQVILTTKDGRFVYKVTSSEVVFPNAIHIIDQTSTRTATLFACTPPGSTRQRLVIHLVQA
ncbi:MAG: class E sortase [Actinomycetota bacterium]